MWRLAFGFTVQIACAAKRINHLRMNKYNLLNDMHSGRRCVDIYFVYD